MVGIEKTAPYHRHQFQQKTGLDRRHTVRELKALISRKIIAKIGNGKNITYRFQKDFSQWQSLPKMAPIAKIGNVAIAKNGNDQKILPIILKTNKDSADFFRNPPPGKERYQNPELIHDEHFKRYHQLEKLDEYPTVSG